MFEWTRISGGSANVVDGSFLSTTLRRQPRVPAYILHEFLKASANCFAYRPAAHFSTHRADRVRVDVQRRRGPSRVGPVTDWRG